MEASLKKKVHKLYKDLRENKVTPRYYGDEDFDSLVEESYQGFSFEKNYDKQLHIKLKKTLLDKLTEGYCWQHVLFSKGVYSLLPVARAVFGAPGTTLKGSLRLFSIPWNTSDNSSIEILSKDMHNRAKRCIKEQCNICQQGHDKPYDIVLINYLDPTHSDSTLEDSNCSYNIHPNHECKKSSRSRKRKRINILESSSLLESESTVRELRPDPYYQLGDMALYWHRDSNVTADTSIGIYTVLISNSDDNDNNDNDNNKQSGWSVGLKRAWDVITPPIQYPLNDGVSYYMCSHLNNTHQHVLLCGNKNRNNDQNNNPIRYNMKSPSPRFSATFRVTNETGLWSVLYNNVIKCMKLLNNHIQNNHINNNIDDINYIQDIHTEIECQWIRMFWAHGSHHASLHKDYWLPKIEQLERYWNIMEEYLKRLVCSCIIYKDTANNVRDCLIVQLSKRYELRMKWNNRYNATIYKNLHCRFHPIRRPVFPLPSSNVYNSQYNTTAADDDVYVEYIYNNIKQQQHCFPIPSHLFQYEIAHVGYDLAHVITELSNTNK